jgi:hypothetical protein
VPDEERARAAAQGADRFLNAWHGGPGPRDRLLELADATGEDERLDRYGSGERIERLERRVAELLGKEAAVVMPSGTMAQPIALRSGATAAVPGRSPSTRRATSSSTRTRGTSDSTASTESSSATRTA